MARPFSATDDDVICAAERVMIRDGEQAFTLAAVAREVGLTRAAISIRFANATNLKKIVSDRFVSGFEARVRGIETQVGAAGLLAIADLVAEMVEGRDQLARFVQNFVNNGENPAAMEVVEKRGAILRSVIAGVVPLTAIDQDSTIDAFMAHLMGTLMAWRARSSEDIRGFMRRRTIAWMKLAGIALEGSCG